jgi:hypothetical protein
MREPTTEANNPIEQEFLSVIREYERVSYKGMRHEQVRHVQDMINGRRRKSLDGKRPKDFLPELLLPAPTREAPAGASLAGPVA